MPELPGFNVCERELPPESIDPFLAAITVAGAELTLGQAKVEDWLEGDDSQLKA